jgi:hypothetical protein
MPVAATEAGTNIDTRLSRIWSHGAGKNMDE